MLFLFAIFHFQMGMAAEAILYSKKERAEQTIILNEINAYRIKNHLKPLMMNEAVSKEAKKHSDNMAQGSISFSHKGFNQRVSHLSKEFQSVRGIAENVAYNSRHVEEMVLQWLSSPSHNKNIKGHYNVTGIGIAHNKEGVIYATQIFLWIDDSKTMAHQSS